MAGAKSFTITSQELLPAAPAFVTRVEKVKVVSLNPATGLSSKEIDQRVCIPNPVVPSTFAQEASSGQSFLRKLSKAKVLGFKNPGNACHINAVLSALLTLPIIQLTRDDLHTNCKKQKNCGMCSFKKLFDKIMPSDPQARPVPISSTSFGKLFAANSNIDLDKRNDATSVLMQILLYLRKEEMASSAPADEASKRNHQMSSKNHKFIYEVEDQLMDTTTAIGRYFSFVINSQQFCVECVHPIERNREIVYTIPIFLETDSLDLKSLILWRFEYTPTLGHCPMDSLHSIEEWWDWITYPRCLIVQVIASRRTERPSLNYLEPVNFCLDHTYTVVSAVCNERDGEDSHYYALRKQSAQEWLMIDDDRVSVIKTAQAQDRLMAGAHLLFMEHSGSSLVTFDQPTDPSETKVYEPSDCPMAEQMRVTDKKTQLATGVGLNQPVRLDLVVDVKGAGSIV